MSNTDIVLQWQTAVGQIEHFNDLSRRTRTNAITVVMAAYGGGAVSVVEYPTTFIALSEAELHVSMLIIVFALIYLGAFWAIDMLYYYKMLVAAVLKGRAMEDQHPDLCGLLNFIGQHTSIKHATWLLHLFYAVPFTVGLVFASFMMLMYTPPL